MDLIKWDALQKEIRRKQVVVNSFSQELIELFAKALAESDGKKSVSYYKCRLDVQKGFYSLSDSWLESWPCFREYDKAGKYLLFAWEEEAGGIPEEFWVVDAQRLIEGKLITQDLTSNLKYEEIDERDEAEKKERETYEYLKKKFEGN